MFRKKKPKISEERMNRALGKKPEQGETSRAPREAAWATCRVSWGGGQGDAGIVLDISDTGARVRFNHRPSLPQFVHLDIASQSISVEAEVVRIDGTDIGLRFV